MTEIAGKVTFDTGAGSGIGRALALALGREGAAVAAADIGSERAEEVAEMVLLAVRGNRPVVVTDESYRKVFLDQYVDPVLAAFDDVIAFDAAQKDD
jgi:NAD(P)-dependent dehydrogenase (short-subunit alcohol dehydrogenase family)